MPKQTRAGGSPVVFLLYGKRFRQEVYFDEYLAGEHIARIEAQASQGGDIAITEYDAGDAKMDLADCLDEVFTPALWGGARLVILNRAEAVLAPAAGDRAGLEAVLKRMSAAVESRGTGRLVLIARGLEIAGRSPSSSFPAARELIKAVKEAGGLCPCIPPYEGELKQALVRRAAKSGVKLMPAAADALIQTVGGEQLALQEELDKLLAACGREKVIAVEDVESIASARSQATVFTLADRVLDGDLGAALADLRALRETPATRSASYILAGTTASFRRCLTASLAIEKGESPAAALARLKVPERFRAGYAARLKRWNSDSLLALLDRVLESDVEMKTGTQSEDVALESLVMDACRQRLRRADLVGRWLYEI